MGAGTSGTFLTSPAPRTNFTFAAASCASSNQNPLVMRTIAEGGNSFFLHLGDMHYQDISANETSSFLAGVHLLAARHHPAPYLPRSVRHGARRPARAKLVAGHRRRLRVGRPRLWPQRLRRQQPQPTGRNIVLCAGRSHAVLLSLQRVLAAHRRDIPRLRLGQVPPAAAAAAAAAARRWDPHAALP